MKKALTWISVTTLAVNSLSLSIVGVNQIKTIERTDVIPMNDKATQYAQETAIIPKSLFISKNQAYDTLPLIKDLNNKLVNPNLQFNLPTQSDANNFINNLTTNVDLETINNIQANFQASGAKQVNLDNANNEIAQMNSYKSYYGMFKQYFNNKMLGMPGIAGAADVYLRQANDFVPNIGQYLSYLKYNKFLTLISNELLQDWDQQAAWGTDTMSAMKAYIASPKGDIAEGKTAGSKGQWHYVAVRADKWTWNDFYQYMAGANLNYVIKLLTGGKYLGQLVEDNITWSGGLISFPNGFNTDNFLKTITTAFDKLSTTPETWPYMIKGIVPIIKAKVLKLADPTKGISKISWDAANDSTTVQIKAVIQELQHLLSPEGRQDLIDMLVSVLNGPTGEDVVIHVSTILGTWTLPEIFSKFSWLADAINPEKIATQIVDALDKATAQINLDEIFNEILDFANQYLTNNPIIDVNDVNSYLNNIFNDQFNQALDEIIDIVNNPKTSEYHAQAIFKLLGVNFGGSDFTAQSPLWYLEQWLNAPNSSINQIINVFTNEKDNNGIAENLIKKDQAFLQDNYYKYFDMTNTTYFKISDAKITNGVDGQYLSYDLMNQLDQQKYHLVFKQFINSDTFLLMTFHKTK